MTISIELNRGMVAVVDDQDFDMVRKYKWHAHVHSSGHVYARTNIPCGKNGKRQKGLLMHRLILGINDPSVKCDHRDGDGLNNTRENIRTCSVSQNGMNKGAQRNSSTGVKGVSPCGKRFAATIRVNGKQKHLGCFDTVARAKAAYDIAALRHHKEFANTSSVKPEKGIPIATRRNHTNAFSFYGAHKSGQAWAKILGISTSSVYRRLEKFGSIELVIKHSDAALFKRMVQESTGIPVSVEG